MVLPARAGGGEGVGWGGVKVVGKDAGRHISSGRKSVAGGRVSSLGPGVRKRENRC